ncbi:hypothetical protein TCAL_00766 [Tigriopus californicus]|uniref:Major facilitator superfamily (MFS) profile domain-containing protein n=1 Tax=Tigriopus californicus TaxID=6832 RepID=A0A553PDI3_TIGCA|nr:solute carrier family 22 member 1-like isoform X2 [Tigriopus californicus]TRY75750.1 hypothetical protein TCAL_00766 [Tigriopus californicus]|eukprot:TCALIF_00766-PA protein Name:"Similar to Slc22a1 Solute carrier family 22 member 1 (Rattus norvegicus)" AED:0.10 eAED:0.10 QI:0/1/0.88/1/1/1/9/147/569
MVELTTPTTLTNFEDLLNLIGGWCRYQKTLLAFFFFNCMFLAYAAYTPVLFLYTPDHFCSVDHIWNATGSQELLWHEDQVLNLLIPIEEFSGKRSKCLMYNVSVDVLSELTALEMENRTEFEKIPCSHGWYYNTTGLFTSVITDMDWVCDDAWKGPFSQSMFSIGALFGTLLFGYMADTYGRLSAWYASNIVLMVAGLATPFMSEFIGFSCMRFLQGMSYDSFFTIFYVLALECVSSDKRALIGNLALAIGMTVAGCYEPWTLYFLQNWKILNTILYAQVAVIILAPWFVFESIRWLASQGRIDEAYETILKIAKVNGMEIDPSLESQIKKILANEEEIKPEGEMQKKATLLDLMRKPNLRKNFIIMVIVFMLTYGLFDTNVRVIGNLEQSIYITFTISSFLELPADLLAILGLDWIGRRWSAFTSLLFSGIAMGVGSLMTSYPLIVMILTMFGRFFVTYALNTALNIGLEIIPTVVRGQGLAVGRLMSCLAIFCSPYIVFTGTIDKSIPYIIIAIVSFFAACMATLLPETADEELPDTLEDGEKFGKKQSFWNVPFLKNRKETQQINL